MELVEQASILAELTSTNHLLSIQVLKRNLFNIRSLRMMSQTRYRRDSFILIWCHEIYMSLRIIGASTKLTKSNISIVEPFILFRGYKKVPLRFL